jgi:LemA protein
VHPTETLENPMTVVLVLIVVALAAIAWFSYNRLVKLRNRVDEAWSQIDVQLKRRHDLIPNLIETVRGYAAHERQTLDMVVQARAAALNARDPRQLAQAENALSRGLSGLFAVAENYPDLKANQNFLQLQEELVATEDRIAYARKFFNDSVRDNNTAIDAFPTKLFAGMAGATKREYFEIDQAERAVPQVRF